MANLLIENGYVLTMDADDSLHAPGWVWTAGDRIEALGSGSAPENLVSRADRVIDAAQMAVLPGLTNGHTHLSQTFMRGLGDDTKLGGAGVIMAILGGAVLTQAQGFVSDYANSINLAYWVPLVAFGVIAYYGAVACRKDLPSAQATTQ